MVLSPEWCSGADEDREPPSSGFFSISVTDEFIMQKLRRTVQDETRRGVILSGSGVSTFAISKR